MAIINKKMSEVLKLILLLDQMDTPSLMLLARDADTLLAYQNSEQKPNKSQDKGKKQQ